MSHRKHYVSTSVAVALALMMLPAVVLGQQSTPDYEATAKQLVDQCAAIHEGDLVFIHGRPNEMQLIEHIAVHVRKLGAFPLVSITTDELERRLCLDVPARFDTQKPMLDLKLAEMMNAMITVRAEENPALLADAPAERLAARQQAMKQVYQKLLDRNVRIVELGNGLFPTAAKARELGISLDELTTVFWRGVNVDYTRLQAIADTVRARLARGKTVHIQSDNGTDLRVGIQQRPIHVNDGVITSDDIRIGKAACQVWLPAGEVYLAPVPETAEGTVVIDRHYFQGREIRNLRMTFQKGKLTSLTADAGLESLKKLYDASGTGKDEFGAIDIGINPDVRMPPNSRMDAWMASGAITVGIGMNTWAGGENDSDFGLYAHVRNGTLMVDGDPLVTNGVLRP